MKKTKTEYYFDVENTLNTSVILEVNEEAPEYIKISYQQYCWDSKDNYIKFFKWIIKELENFK